MSHIINLKDKLHSINKPWSPVDLLHANDQVIRMALIEGEYHWHKHVNEDEVFYVIKGQVIIQLKDQPDIFLKEGEMAVVPKGAEHCPISPCPSYILMIEPSVLKSKGD